MGTPNHQRIIGIVRLQLFSSKENAHKGSVFPTAGAQAATCGALRRCFEMRGMTNFCRYWQHSGHGSVRGDAGMRLSP
jgi:hypothetical protein